MTSGLESGQVSEDKGEGEGPGRPGFEHSRRLSDVTDTKPTAASFVNMLTVRAVSENASVVTAYGQLQSEEALTILTDQRALAVSYLQGSFPLGQVPGEGDPALLHR